MLAVDGYDEQCAQQALKFLREYCGPGSTGPGDAGWGGLSHSRYWHAHAATA